MKTVRFVTFVLVIAIVFSSWTPALASPQAGGSGATNAALVSLTIVNRSFGALQVSMEGSGGSYWFYVVQGKSTYQIVPGKYTYTVHFAANNLCKGWRSTKFGDYLVKTSKFNNAKNTLGPYRYCNLG